MGRIPLLTTREGLTDHQQDVFDWIVESRGRMLRPYEVLLHAPGLARPAAELGHQIRFAGVLSDHDRELAIIAAAKMHACGFEWDSHVELAREAGVSDATIAALDTGSGEVEPSDQLIVEFVRELGATSDVADERVAAVEAIVGGVAAVVELTALVGYYTFLSFIMKVAGAC